MSTKGSIDWKYLSLVLGVLGALGSNFIKPAVEIGAWQNRMLKIESAYAEERADLLNFKQVYQQREVSLAGRLASIETKIDGQKEVMSSLDTKINALLNKKGGSYV